MFLRGGMIMKMDVYANGCLSQCCTENAKSETAGRGTLCVPVASDCSFFFFFFHRLCFRYAIESVCKVSTCWTTRRQV